MSSAAVNQVSVENKITDSVLIKSILAYLNEPAESERRIRIQRKNITLATKPGDNYISFVYQVDVDYFLDDEPFEAHFIVKCIQDDEVFSDLVKESQVFEKEMVMYEKLLPELEEKAGVSFSPRCFHVQEDGHKLMVFSDMKDMGFKMGNRSKGLDFEHCKLVVISLAKFHASSMVLVEDGKLDLMSQFGQGMSTAGILVEFVFKPHLVKLIETVSKWSEPEFKELPEILERILTNYLTVYKLPMKTDVDEFQVLNHGDAWVNNFMFAYDAEGLPVNVILLDYQMPFYTSPGYDLHYFMITSPDLETRLHHEKELLEIYRMTFNKKLFEMGFTSFELTKEKLRKSYEQKSIYGFTMMLTILPIIMRTVAPEGDSDDKEAVVKNMLQTLFGNEEFLTILKHSMRKFKKLGTFNALSEICA